jgi:hypothetical protein
MKLNQQQQDYLKSLELLCAMGFCLKKLTGGVWTLEQYNYVLGWLRENHPSYLEIPRESDTIKMILEKTGGKLL